MQVELQHPTALSAKKEGLVRLLIDRSPDPLWHFKIAMRHDWRLGPEGAAVPTTDSMESLALFKHRDPEADVEVMGYVLPAEVDPADWLEVSLADQGKTVVSRKPVRLLAGVVGDVVATWDVEGEPFAGRFFASKWGPRLFVLALRARAADYPRFADDFFASIATFEAVDDSLGLFAERVNFVAQQAPLPWKTAVPISWRIEEEEPSADGGERGAAFQARQKPLEGDERDFYGQLSFAVLERGLAERARDAANGYFRAVRDNGIVVGPHDFEEETPPKGFEHAWLATAPATHAGSSGVLFCRVLLHPRCWVVGGVLCPTRDADPMAWMRSKRALDIATYTLELSP
ncbi:MAG: hypothetical protein HY908_14545 [Myxococcales bacterium]|nr:hypothetical protein [Myxococcales bacterium]